MDQRKLMCPTPAPTETCTGVTSCEKMNNIVCSKPERLFYSAKEVAAMFGTSTKTIYRLVDRGLLKSSNVIRSKMIEANSIQQFVLSTINGGGVK